MNKKYDKIYKGLRKQRIRKRIRIKPKNKKPKQKKKLTAFTCLKNYFK